MGRLGTILLAALPPVLVAGALGCVDPQAKRHRAPQRIVAMAPSVTETLFELGLGERVVGVGDYSVWPPEAATRPRLGGLFDPRLETIVQLEPDLAILLASQESLALRLGSLGIEVLTVGSDTLAEVEEGIERIAERCGAEAEGEELLSRWRAGLAPRPGSSRRRVLMTVGREAGRMSAILVAGPATYLDELLHLLGAVNVLADSSLAYPQVGLEEILLRGPEVIVELQSSPADYRSLLDDWAELPELPAVAAGCVRVVAGAHVLVPGPRLPRLYRELAEALDSCVVAR